MKPSAYCIAQSSPGQKCRDRNVHDHTDRQHDRRPPKFNAKSQETVDKNFQSHTQYCYSGDQV